jgi:hypothetical protein
MLEITPLIKTHDGTTYRLLGYSALDNKLHVQTMNGEQATTLFKDAVPPRDWSPLEIKEDQPASTN